MKKETIGTHYVPVHRPTDGKFNSFINYFLPEECKVRSRSDFYYVTAIAFASAGFIYPPLFIGAVACVVAAKNRGLKKLSSKVCGFKKNVHLCIVHHLRQARRLANIAAGIFYVHSYTYSSVPCGALMRPQPVSGGEQRGAELFLFPSHNNQHIVSF